MGAVHLSVADLDRSLAYWERSIGLLRRVVDGRVAWLGAGGDDLVVLHEVAGAQPVSGRTGLYHLALLLPGRDDLARWLRHAATTRVPITGAADHLVSEAIYLTDPDGHGIEIYVDRPRSTWDWSQGDLSMATLALDLDALLNSLEVEAPTFAGQPAGTTMGHVHVHVRDIAETEHFYRDVVGFDVTVRLAGSATFLSAGGYHHHLGANVWAGRGAPPAPPGSASLRHFTIILPDATTLDALASRIADGGQTPTVDGLGVWAMDPSANRILLADAASATEESR